MNSHSEYTYIEGNLKRGKSWLLVLGLVKASSSGVILGFWFLNWRVWRSFTDVGLDSILQKSDKWIQKIIAHKCQLISAGLMTDIYALSFFEFIDQIFVKLSRGQHQWSFFKLFSWGIRILIWHLKMTPLLSPVLIVKICLASGLLQYKYILNVNSFFWHVFSSTMSSATSHTVE